jgi:hypothetical protein
MSNNKLDPTKFPYPVLCVIIFLLLGFMWDLWRVAWIVFLTIPIFYAIVSKDKAFKSVVPIILVAVFLFIGFMWNLWHIAWIVFLTLPIINYFIKGTKQDDEDPMTDDH